MTLLSFADTTRLSLDELRSRLRSGDPQERVWCAWALGLRLQQGATPLVMSSARFDEDAGVRRHAIVMLAGAGELDLLGTLATLDPDVHVRATAIQYVMRLLDGAAHPLWSFVVERLHQDAAGEVRVAIILNAPADGAELLRDAVRGCVADRDAFVREAAVERILSWPGPFPDVIAHQAGALDDESLRSATFHSQQILSTCVGIEKTHLG